MKRYFFIMLIQLCILSQTHAILIQNNTTNTLHVKISPSPKNNSESFTILPHKSKTLKKNFLDKGKNYWIKSNKEAIKFTKNTPVVTFTK